MEYRIPKDLNKEYLAKFIIEDVLPDYGAFENSDKPDLQGSNIGIEVTLAYPFEYMRAVGEHTNAIVRNRIHLRNGDYTDLWTADRNSPAFLDVKKHVDKAHVLIQREHSRIEAESHIREYGLVFDRCLTGDFYEDYSVDVFRALDHKLQKLNEPNDDGSLRYGDFGFVGLFINSMIGILEKDYVDLRDNLRKISSSYCLHYDFVLIYSDWFHVLWRYDFVKDAISFFPVDPNNFKDRYDILHNDISEGV